MASTVYKIYRDSVNGDFPFEVNVGKCQLVGWNLVNPNTSNVYLKIGDTNVAWDPGDPPAMKRTLLIPAQGTVMMPNEDKFQLNFSQGIFIWVTGGLPDNDVTAIGSSCLIELFYNT